MSSHPSPVPLAVPLQTSPIAHFPTEILAEIFEVTVRPKPKGFLTPNNTGTDRRHFKIIRSVCRQWRNTAFATPSLWSIAWIDLVGRTAQDVPGIVLSLRSYFGRAGPSIQLTFGFRWSTTYHECPDPFESVGGPGTQMEGEIPIPMAAWDVWMGFLLDYRNRWEELSFFTTPTIFQMFEEGLRRDAVKNAEKWTLLYLQVTMDGSTPHALPGLDQTERIAGDILPALVTLSVNAQDDTLFKRDVRHRIALGPHSNLRKLRVNVHDDLNTYFSGLGTGFPMLQKLFINIPILEVIPVQEDGPTIELPQLTLLIMSCVPSFGLLKRLRAPALRTLLIETYVPPGPCSEGTVLDLKGKLAGSFGHVIDFVRRCSWLRKVKLNTWFLEEDEPLRKLFEGIGAVEMLCIDTWFRFREDRSGGLMCLPNLRMLCLHHRRDDDRTPRPVTEGYPELGDASQPDSGDNEDKDDEEESPDPPFIRRQPSWLLLASFLIGLNQQKEGKGFMFCISGQAYKAGGWETRQMLGNLERAGVFVKKEPFCKSGW